MQDQHAYLYLDLYRETKKKKGKGNPKKKKKEDLASGVSNAGKVKVITVHRGDR